MRLGTLTLAIAAVVSTVSTAQRAAQADEKQACVAAADDAQQQRIDGKLKAARAQLLVCGRPDCPTLVRSDCEKWMSEVLTLLPTIVLAVRDAQGSDVAAVEVSIDGAVVARGLDGKPLEIDPGMHTVRVVSPAAGQAAEERILVREGEKGRAVSITLGGSPGVVAQTPAVATSETPARPAGAGPSHTSSTSPWTWVFGGVGVVALGVGAALELAVNAEASSLSSSCHSQCNPDQVHPLVIEQQIVGPIAFGVGAVSLAAALYFLVRGWHDGDAIRSASIRGSLTGIVGSF